MFGRSEKVIVGNIAFVICITLIDSFETQTDILSLFFKSEKNRQIAQRKEKVGEICFCFRTSGRGKTGIDF